MVVAHNGGGLKASSYKEVNLRMSTWFSEWKRSVPTCACWRRLAAIVARAGSQNCRNASLDETGMGSSPGQHMAGAVQAETTLTLQVTVRLLHYLSTGFATTLGVQPTLMVQELLQEVAVPRRTASIPNAGMLDQEQRSEYSWQRQGAMSNQLQCRHSDKCLHI